jgi:type I restriction enzyme M protein
MNLALKRAIVEYIRRKDPNGDVVASITPSNDWMTGNVQYNFEHLGKGRDCGYWDDTYYTGAEELVRAYLLVRLVKDLRYPLDKSIILEEPYSIGHPSHKEARLDIRVGDRREAASEKSFMLIECKAPERYHVERTEAIQNQLFCIAPLEHTTNNHPVRYLNYYSVHWEGDQIREEMELIDFSEHQNWEEWDAAGQPVASTTIPADYGVAVTSVYINKRPDQLQQGEQLLDRSKDRDFFQRLQKDLYNKLWGGSTEYNYVFKNLARLFLAKIYDEMTTQPGKAYSFQVRHRTDPTTSKTAKESVRELFERINQLSKESTVMLGYSEKENRGYGIEEDYVDANKVAYVVNQLEGISVVENVHARNGDILGDFYEGIISQGFKQDRGTFFTHKNIVYFVLYGLCLDDLVRDLATDSADPRLPFICDAACGSGTFLVEGMKFVTKFLPSKNGQVARVRQALSKWSTDEAPHLWAGEYVYGIDDNLDLALSTKVNMVLHRDGNLNIFKSDALRPFAEFPNTPVARSSTSLLLQHQEDKSAPYPYDTNEQFDIVVSNPPFAVPMDPERKKSYRRRFLFADTPNSEVIFLERYYQLLRPNGRLGIVLPESVFDTGENLPVRLFLYRHFELLGIVSLPQLAFNPFTSTKTCLLFARKKTREEVAAFDSKWKSAADEYKSLRKHPLVKWGIENRRLHDALMNLCVGIGYDYSPMRNSLLPDDLESLLHGLTKAPQQGKTDGRRVTDILRRIDLHFARAPFRSIRTKSDTWVKGNSEMLKLVKDFADSVGVAFQADEHGHISPECFTEQACDLIAAAARAADSSRGHGAKRYQNSWDRIRKKVEKYLSKSVNGDLSHDTESRRVLKRYLKSSLDEHDGNLPLLDLVDKYLDDIVAIGEINDTFGKFPNQPKMQPLNHANAWWVFGEVVDDPTFRYDIFMAQAEEIGYKRGKGNRYQSRRNDLFSCDDPNDLLHSIRPDAPDAILGALRAHVHRRKNSHTRTLSLGFLSGSQNIAGQVTLRADPKFRFFWDVLEGNPLASTESTTCLRSLSLPCPKVFVPKGHLEEAHEIVELDLVEPRTSLYLTPSGDYEPVDEIGGPKLKFGPCTFVFSNLRPYLGKIVLNEPERDLIGSNKWIPVRLKGGVVDPVYLKYLLLTSRFLETYSHLCWGKSMPQMSEHDLLRIRFPLPTPDRQRDAGRRIVELESQLTDKHRGLKSKVEIVDEIFAQEFGYARDQQKASVPAISYKRNIHDFAGSFDLRGGVRFHNPKFSSLNSILTTINSRRFRDVVVRPLLRLGASVDPDKDYDDDGEACFVSPAVIKNYEFDLEAAQRVTDEYYQENFRLSGLSENDVVIARSGEGTIGKAAMFDGQGLCIHGDFTMRVRFNQRIKPEFGLYFCCSSLFQLQVEKNKRGMGNMTNFFPSQLLSFWITCPSPERQEQIAEATREALSCYERQREEVRLLRDRIDEIVLNSLN